MRSVRRIMISVVYVLGFLPGCMLALMGFRFLQSAAIGRIGHQALEIDSFLKERRLGLQRWCVPVVLAPRGQVANATLMRYWRRHVLVLSNPLLCRLAQAFAWCRPLWIDAQRYIVALNDTAAFVTIQAQWGERPPLLELTEPDRVRGRKCLASLGVPEGAWFVCVHSREGGFSPGDEHYHAYRNSHIDSYVPAMREITARGGWCIRVGDPTMKALPPMPNVIDYAHSPVRSDWMDVFLCASCRYFLGNTSGLIFLASIFGVPVAQANAIPVSAVLTYGARDRGIPKLIWSDRMGRHLDFAEILGSPVGDFRFAELYAQERLRVCDNAPEEIAELALEMLEITEGKFVVEPSDEALQKAFKRLMRPGHYTYGGTSRVGRGFLRRHRAMLPDVLRTGPDGDDLPSSP